MLLTKKTASSYKMPTELRLYGKEIPFSKTAKYLGITLDDKLSLKPHIENKIKKAKRTLMVIRSTIEKSWGPSPLCARWSCRSNPLSVNLWRCGLVKNRNPGLGKNKVQKTAKNGIVTNSTR
jgi:hypothetical protein